MVNEHGGINGRKINSSAAMRLQPAKTVEQVRQLVEQDQVLFLFQHAGHPDEYRDPRLPQ